jgi:hypothetical protein
MVRAYVHGACMQHVHGSTNVHAFNLRIRAVRFFFFLFFRKKSMPIDIGLAASRQGIVCTRPALQRPQAWPDSTAVGRDAACSLSVQHKAEATQSSLGVLQSFYFAQLAMQPHTQLPHAAATWAHSLPPTFARASVWLLRSCD